MEVEHFILLYIESFGIVFLWSTNRLASDVSAVSDPYIFASCYSDTAVSHLTGHTAVNVTVGQP